MACRTYLRHLPGFSGSTSTRVSRVHLDQALRFRDLHLYPPVSKSIMAYTIYLGHLPGVLGSTSTRVSRVHPVEALCFRDLHLYPPVSKSIMACTIYLGYLPGFSGSSSTRACPVHPTRVLHFLDLQLLGSTSTRSSAHKCPDLSWPARSTWDIYRGFQGLHLPGSAGATSLKPYVSEIYSFAHQCPNLPWLTGSISTRVNRAYIY